MQTTYRLALTALLLMISGTAAAQEAPEFPDSPYLIIAQHSGMSIDVRNAAHELALLQTAGLGGQSNREFEIRPARDGFFTITARHSGLSFDVQNAGGNMSLLQTAGRGGQANREFAITRLPGGYYKIAARHSGLTLDVRDAQGAGSLIQTAGDGGQSNREWLMIPVKSVASQAYVGTRKPAVAVPPPDLRMLLTASKLTFTTSAPISSCGVCPLDVVVHHVQFGTPVINPDTQVTTVEVSADVAPFTVVYTTDVSGPPLQLAGKQYDRAIRYPVQLGLLIPEARITGTMQIQEQKITGKLQLNCNGLLAVGAPVYAGIPAPRGDNDPEDGLPGWEYKTWDKPFDGVRQPRRNDLKGAPEFIRGNIGPWNGYLFLRPKAHPFKLTVDLSLQGAQVTSRTTAFTFERPFVKCPEDFKNAWQQGQDWDYAVDASGPFAGLVQDAIEKDIVSTFTKATSQTFPIHWQK